MDESDRDPGGGLSTFQPGQVRGASGEPVGVVGDQDGERAGTQTVEHDQITVAEYDTIGIAPRGPVHCLSLRYQVAQKFHACADELDGIRDNDRGRDLVDLQLLALVIDDGHLASIRTACVEIFAGRRRHEWPPEVRVWPAWPTLYTAAASSLGDDVLARRRARRRMATNRHQRYRQLHPMSVRQPPNRWSLKRLSNRVLDNSVVWAARGRVRVIVTATVSSVADFELVRTDGGLIGVVGEQRVELRFDIPSSRAGVRGECFGSQVGAYWRIESNFNNLDPVGVLLGEYDGEPVHLRNEVHLTPYYALSHADLSGTIGERELSARIAPVEAPAHGPTITGVDGNYDGAAITLFVTIEGDLSEAHIHGIIDGRAISIDATPSAVTGRYDGPAPLFPLLVSCLLYFL